MGGSSFACRRHTGWGGDGEAGTTGLCVRVREPTYLLPLQRRRELGSPVVEGSRLEGKGESQGHTASVPWLGRECLQEGGQQIMTGVRPAAEAGGRRQEAAAAGASASEVRYLSMDDGDLADIRGPCQAQANALCLCQSEAALLHSSRSGSARKQERSIVVSQCSNA